MSEQMRTPAPARTFDWDAARQDLARLQAYVDALQSPPPERARQVLRERSVALAKPRPKPRDFVRVSLIVFGRRGHRWATLGHQVREVIDLASITPLPGVPADYLGLIHHRGLIYPVVDVGALLGIAAGAPGKQAQALIVEGEGAAAAIAADAIEGYTTIDAASIAEMTPDAVAHPALQGLTPDLATVFDAYQLLADPRLVVNDQPAATARTEGRE